MRYRYDRQRRKHYKTIKLIKEEGEWIPPDPFAAHTIIGVRVELAEVELQRRVKQACG